MRLTAIIMLSACLTASANSFSQITISEKNVPLQTVFKEIQKQSGYEFFYTYELLSRQGNVTVNLKNASLQQALHEILKEKPLTYEIINKTVVIMAKPESVAASPFISPPIDIHGRIVDEDGEPVIASIMVKGADKGTNSNSNGEFQLTGVDEKAILVISATNIVTTEVRLGGRTELKITVKKKVSALDETVVIAYGTTTQRLNTGNVSTVKGEEIAKQPVISIIQALEGRVPGMAVSQVTGVPGARLPVQIRGRANFDNDLSSDQPLFILDGVPLAANNDRVNIVSTQVYGASPTDGLSALAGINPSDIESIEVLKDADATAIYGSRGANGVILITTKKGHTGKMRINAQVAVGANVASQLPKMLNTQQYVTMRNEAFANDGLTKTNANAYDLLMWDTTRYTDFAKLLIGNTAQVADAQVSVTGGDRYVSYRAGGSYHKEGTVWAGDKSTERTTVSFSINTLSQNEKLSMSLSGSYGININDHAALDLASAVLLPPNYQVYNNDGNLAWNEGGYNSNRDNPLAQVNQEYLTKVSNLNASLVLNYKLLKNLQIRSNIGYNATLSDDRRLTPIATQNPSKTNLAGQTLLGISQYKSWIIEPQVEYKRLISRGKLDVLLGGTFNKRFTQGQSIVANGYTSDLLLGSLSGTASGNISASNSESQYSYQAFFGRINYNWADKYVVNLTGRRDGSSRFGPELRFANFGAVGAAWIFSNESFLKKSTVLSYGKLRASYGSTGNDQIGDYVYLDSWEAGATYYDSATLLTTRLFNPYLHWERNNKLEVAVELGFLQDRILLSTAFYRNISFEPLVFYPLSGAAGFSSVITNLEGVEIENKGIEITLTTRNIEKRNFKWRTNFNITIPRNELKKYPNLELSSYNSRYVIGEPLNLIYAYMFAGVDPDTGTPTVQDVDGDGFARTAYDFINNGTTDPKFYGGFNNTVSYKNFSFSFFFQFVKQMGRSWFFGSGLNPAGTYYNVPDVALERWQKPGQVTEVPKFTNSRGSIIGLNSFYALYFSNKLYTDASYIRLKNVAVSYDVDTKWLSKMHLHSLRVFVQGQNLLTFSKYKISDPEIQNFTRMPTLRSFLAGVQIAL